MATRQGDVNSFTAGRYQVERFSRWADFEPRWTAMLAAAPSLPFHSTLWLRTWFGTFAGSAAGASGAAPVLLAVSEDGRDVMLLPLVAWRKRAMRLITFADFDVTDCGAPLLAATAPQDAAGAEDLFNAVLRSLPPADVLRLDKMPARIGALANPLCLVSGVQRCRYRQHIISLQSGWAEHLRSVSRRTRKELSRSWRLFEAAGAKASFRFARDAEDGAVMLSALHAAQLERLAARGARHVFQRPGFEAFYQRLVAAGAGGDQVLVAALELDGRIVAALLGVAARPRVTMIRLAHESGELSRIGLGRLLLERTINALSEQGYRDFDLSIGEGMHKDRFGAEPEALHALQRSLTWRALPFAAAAGVRNRLRHMPAVQTVASGLRRMAASAKSEPSSET